MGPQRKPDCRCILSKKKEDLCSQQRGTFVNGFMKELTERMKCVGMLPQQQCSGNEVSGGVSWALALEPDSEIETGGCCAETTFGITYTCTHLWTHTNTHSRVLLLHLKIKTKFYIYFVCVCFVFFHLYLILYSESHKMPCCFASSRAYSKLISVKSDGWTYR